MGKTIAIMQPYFLPYIGYFQLLNAVDEFVIYDDLEFTKKGWINRNRLHFNGRIEYFTINLKHCSDYELIKNKQISSVFIDKEKKRILNKIYQSYKKAPHFTEVFEMTEQIFEYDEINLFKFIKHSIEQIQCYLQIDTKLIDSSVLNVNPNYRGVNRVIQICKELRASKYINPEGGVELYSKDEFEINGINLFFLQTQIYDDRLSIIDTMMYNSKDQIKVLMNEYNLI